MQMPFDESDERIEVDPDLSELPGPQSGDKRASSSRQQAKKSRKKKGKMQQSANETFLNMVSIMTSDLALVNITLMGRRKISSTSPLVQPSCVPWI